MCWTVQLRFRHQAGVIEYLQTMKITTARLILSDLALEQLELMVNDPEALEAQLGFPISRPMLEGPVQRALRMKIERMREEDIINHPWSTYWLIVISEPLFGAGMVGFKGVPDLEGSVEVGYGIDPTCQGKGYMTEALRAMLVWAFSQPYCRQVTARGVLKSNLPSQHVLLNAGFLLFAEDELTTSWMINRAIK